MVRCVDALSLALRFYLPSFPRNNWFHDYLCAADTGMLTNFWKTVPPAEKRQRAQEQHERNDAALADKQVERAALKEGEQAARLHFAQIDGTSAPLLIAHSHQHSSQRV